MYLVSLKWEEGKLIVDEGFATSFRNRYTRGT